MQDAVDSLAVNRARFWQRAIALFIDFTVVSGLITALGIVLYGPTHGAIRIGSSPVLYTTCGPTWVDLATLKLPADFKVTRALTCTSYFFGWEHDRTVVVREVTRTEFATYTRSVTMPIDRNDKIANPLYLDPLIIVLLALYLVLLEWRYGTTIGKRALKIWVRSSDGKALHASRAMDRTAVRFIPVLPFLALAVFPTWLGATQSFESLTSKYFLAGVLLSVGLTLAFLINFIKAVSRGNQPWHDRAAGTEVVGFLPPPPPPPPPPDAKKTGSGRWTPH